MRDLQVLARLRVTPAGGATPSSQAYTLQRLQNSFRVLVVERNGDSKRQTRRYVPVAAAEAQEQLASLRRLTVPAYPVSQRVTDGERLELTVEGQSSSLTLNWWTIAPDGAEGLVEFANWLRIAGQGHSGKHEKEDV